MKLVKYNNKNAYGSKYPPSYPNEMMVKIFSSKTYTNIKIKTSHKNKVLEIGSFSGNNLRYFIENGFETYGIEINQNLVNLGLQNLKRLNVKIAELPVRDTIWKTCLLSIVLLKNQIVN